MTVADLQDLFAYEAWAHRKLFAVLAQLTDEQWTRTVGGSYGSVRNTLVHALSAEWGWLERCGGDRRGPPLDPAAFPTVASFVERQTWVEGRLRALLAELRDQDLERALDFTLGDGRPQRMRIGHALRHALLHGVHHRGQVSLLLRMLGVAPGNFDLFVYYAEVHPAPPAVG